jgi:hypothetical protein
MFNAVKFWFNNAQLSYCVATSLAGEILYYTNYATPLNVSNSLTSSDTLPPAPYPAFSREQESDAIFVRSCNISFANQANI